MDVSMYTRFSSTVRRQGPEAACAMAKELGCSSVEHLEFVGTGREMVLKSEPDALALKNAMQAHGLSMSCYSVAVNLWQKGMNADTVTEAERALLLHAERAKALGSPFLHHTLLLGVDQDALSLDEALSLIVPVAVRVARYAHSLGVTCLYEDQGMYFNGVEGFGAFYYAVKQECPYVGVCGDVGNMLFVDEEAADFFEAFASEMKHVHIKDYIKAKEPDAARGWDRSRGGMWLKETVIGQGCVGVARCLEILKKAKYSGAFSLESSCGDAFAHSCQQGMALLNRFFS